MSGSFLVRLEKKVIKTSVVIHVSSRYRIVQMLTLTGLHVGERMLRADVSYCHALIQCTVKLEYINVFRKKCLHFVHLNIKVSYRKTKR